MPARGLASKGKRQVHLTATFVAPRYTPPCATTVPRSSFLLRIHERTAKCSCILGTPHLFHSPDSLSTPCVHLTWGWSSLFAAFHEGPVQGSHKESNFQGFHCGGLFMSSWLGPCWHLVSKEHMRASKDFLVQEFHPQTC